MNHRDRFLAACRCEALDSPPIWLMRQAGRYLPEYRALKQKYDFLTLVKTPDLAVEVTLQPIRRFGFDAAILFSDILVIPEALGQPYHFRDQGGIGMDFRLKGAGDIDRLDPTGITDKLSYVADALRLLKSELNGKTALLGFGGSPWTLACYMVEGGSSDHFYRVKELFYSDRPLFERLMEKITDALIAYFQMQVEAGAEAIQIFDTWGGICAGQDYVDATLRWIGRITNALGQSAPVILYAKGLHSRMTELVDTGARVISVDWTADLGALRLATPSDVALQGNMDPVLLSTHPDIVRRETTRLLRNMNGARGHIFNLGHGIHPTAKIENVETLVQTVREFVV